MLRSFRLSSSRILLRRDGPKVEKNGSYNFFSWIIQVYLYMHGFAWEVMFRKFTLRCISFSTIIYNTDLFYYV
jgi:hypothetical protein